MLSKRQQFQFAVVPTSQADQPRQMVVYASAITSLARLASSTLTTRPARIAPPEPRPIERSRWPAVAAATLASLSGGVIGPLLAAAMAPMTYTAHGFVRLDDADTTAAERDLRTQALLAGSGEFESALNGRPGVRATIPREQLVFKVSAEPGTLLLRIQTTQPGESSARELIAEISALLADRLVPPEPGTPEQQQALRTKRAELIASRKALASELPTGQPSVGAVGELDRAREQEQAHAAATRFAQAAEAEAQEEVQSRKLAIQRIASLDPVLPGTIPVSTTRPIGDPVLQAAQDEQAQAMKEYWQMIRDRRTPNHPDVLALQDKIDQTRKAMARRRSEMLEESVAPGADPEIRRRQMDLIDAESELTASTLRRMRAEALAAAAVDTLRTAEASATAQADRAARTAQIQSELREMDEQLAAMPAVREPRRATVIAASRATAERSSAGIAWPAVVGVFSGLVTGLLGVWAGQRIRDRKISVADAQTLLGGAVLGMIPDARKVAPTQWLESCGQTSDALTQVRNRILLATGNASSVVIGVVGIVSGQGTTSLATSLSLLMGKTGRRTLLIDGNCVSPDLAGRFGVDATRGWTNFLADNPQANPPSVPVNVPRPTPTRRPAYPSVADEMASAADDAGRSDVRAARGEFARREPGVVLDVAPSVDLLPMGLLIDSAADLLASRGFVSMLETLAEKYAAIVIDLPPLGSEVATDAVLSRLDLVVLTAHISTPSARIHAAGKRLADCGAPLLGAVLSGS